MEKVVQSAHIVRFANFELDLDAGELRNNGLKVKLSGQPFEVLAILLEHHGAVVTREELQKRLWPDSFVDFDHNLNSAINRIREALGDSAENPRFVETLPRRGYRFIAPIQEPRSAGNSSPEQTEDASSAFLPGNKVLNSDTAFFRRFLAAAALLALLVVLGYAWVRTLRPQPTVTRYDRLTSDSQDKTSSYVHEVLSPLLSDGSRLYFTEGPLGNKKAAQVSITGGEVTSFSVPFRVRRIVDISADGRSLLLLGAEEALHPENPLMVLPLPAGPPRRIGDLLAHDASWSPDQAKLVYANGHDLYSANSDGTQSRKLATLLGTPWWPRWSPDAQIIRFTVQEMGEYKLWEVGADGSSLHRLLSDPTGPRFQCCGAWTKNGKYYVFTSLYFSSSQLWAIREPTTFIEGESTPTQVTTGPLNMLAPLPSADDERMFAVGVQQRGQLVRFDQASGQFVPFLFGISAQGVDISKDGKWATYVTAPEGTLWRSRVDGSERLQLTLPPMQVSLPRWSPDGKHIAFLGRAAIGKPLKLYLISSEGGNPVQAIAGERGEGEPSWSPDGASIAFAPLYWEGTEQQPAIYTLNVSTGRVALVPDSQGLFSARWSPDGHYIAGNTADSKQTLVLLDLATHKRVDLCGPVAYPNWSRDGRYIYFNDPYSDNPGLYRVRITDRKVEKITSLDPNVLRWAIIGKWTGLDTDDSPLVLRDTSIEEIYAIHWTPTK